jgi:hypothetical protein
MPTTDVRLRKLSARAAPLAIAALAITPFVIAASRICRDQVFPVSDHAVIALRARDVGTEHQPLYGEYTTAAFGKKSEEAFNNIGPSHFIFLAPWVRLCGPACGLAVGAATLNAAAVLTIGWAVRRRAGPFPAVLGLAVALALAWSMGGSLLHDVWMPYQLMLPGLAVLLCAWVVADGDARCLPVLLAWATLALQTHLSYLYLVGVTTVVALAYFAVRRPPWQQWQWPLAASVLVTLFLWLPPVIEEIGAPDRGNLTRLWMAFLQQSDGAFVGVARGVRMVAAVVSLPPFWLRPSLTTTFRPRGTSSDNLGLAFGSLPTLPATLAGLAVLCAALLAAIRHGRREGARPLGATLPTLCAATLIALIIGAARLPIPRDTGVTPYMTRWLWPGAAFITFGLALGPLLRLRSGRFRALTAAATVGAFLLATAGASLDGPAVALTPWRLHDRAAPVYREARERTAAATRSGDSVLLELHDFFDPIGVAVALDLTLRGRTVFVQGELVARRLGPNRLWKGQRVRKIIGVRSFEPGARPPDDAQVLFHSRGLAVRERARLRALRHDLVRHLRRGDLQISASLADLVRRSPPLRYVLEVERSATAARRAVRSNFLILCRASEACDLGTDGNEAIAELEALQVHAVERQVLIWLRRPEGTRQPR